MTPLAVIDRYLDAAATNPLDSELFTELLGLDADLLGRWLLLVGGPAEPAAFTSRLRQLAPDHFQELAVSQALAVLTVSGGARLGAEPWRNALIGSYLAEGLAEGQQLEAGVTRWRVLLALAGIPLPDDPPLADLLAFRGVRPDLLEDADPLSRIFAVVDLLDLLDPEPAQRVAARLLGMAPLDFQDALRAAESRARSTLAMRELELDQDLDRTERLWLRLRVGLLSRLFSESSTDRSAWPRLGELHGGVTRMLFAAEPMLLLLDQSAGRLESVSGRGPRIAIESATSVVARSARLGERVEFYDEPEAAVADRHILRILRAEAAVCLPISAAPAQPVLGVLLFPFAEDEDEDDEFAMQLYARELARRLAAAHARQQTEQQGLQRFRVREEQRLRELVHEANNPLSIVQNYLHLLEMTLAAEPKAVEQLRLIGAELRRVGNLLAQMRHVPDVSESAQETVVEPRLVDLDALVARLVEMHRGYAKEREASISAALPATPVRLRSDDQRIAQVLSNLIRNGIEASREHSVRVEVLGGAFRDGREGVLLSISDTGPGMPREVLERIGSPQRSNKGGDHAGLGLLIVHRLVGELSGSMDIRTAPGLGTTITIFLPLSP